MRLFVGIELDDRVKAAAAAASEQLRAALRRARIDLDGRWVEPENLHVSVWFIGEAGDDRAREIQRALAPGFLVPAFDLHVKAAGAFPPSGPPRVFWLGIAGGAESMALVYGEVRERLVSLGFEPERRPYSPHVTIARIRGVRSRISSSSENRDLTPRAPQRPRPGVRSRFSSSSENRDLTPPAPQQPRPGVRSRFSSSSENRDLTPEGSERVGTGRRDVRDVREVLEGLSGDCGACRVEAVTLFRSHLSPRGARYEPLLRVPLS
jgi:2'-5' RNA ligase